MSVVITGATSGLGRATARVIARSREHQVVVAARDGARGGSVLSELSKISVHPVIVLPLDLERLASVQAFAAALASSRAAPLGGLICNAGVQDVAGVQRTVDGVERTFAVNHLAHFALTTSLLPLLSAGSRVVVVTCDAHDPSKNARQPAPRFTSARALALGDQPEADPLKAGRTRYATSKLCNLYFVRALARRLAESSDVRLRSMRAVAFNPGMMPGTGLARDLGPFARFAWSYLLPGLTLVSRDVNTVGTSASHLAALALEPQPTWTSGAYITGGVIAAPSEDALDDRRSDELWNDSAALLRAMPLR